VAEYLVPIALLLPDSSAAAPGGATDPTDGPAVDGTHGHVLHLPSPLASLRHSLPALVEGVLGPFALFYLVLVLAGFKGALIAGLVWSYLALGRRMLRHERPPGTLVLAVVTLTARTIVSFVTGSAFIYFAQPTLTTAVIGVVFLGSAAIRRPVIERLANDFCPLDPKMMARPPVRRFFLQISVLWAAVLLANAGVVLWLLLTSSLRAFVLERTVFSWSLTIVAIAVSVLWFVRTMRRTGIHVRFGGAPSTVAATESSAGGPGGC
jgi:hypothetical protein